MQNETAGISINIQKALSSKNCAKKGKILSLGLLSSKEERSFLNELRKIQGNFFGKEQVLSELDNYIQNHAKREWFRMDAQYDFVMNEEAAYQKSLASFFIGKKTVANNILWTVKLPYMLGSMAISEVYGYVTAVTENEGRYTAVMIADGIPNYSQYARLEHKKPLYSPELIGAYLGLKSTFGDDLKVMIAYTRPRKSSNSNLFSEHNNIVSADFSNFTESELRRRLINVLTKKTEEPDCTTCFYEAVCSGMYLPQKKQAEEAAPTKNKTPLFTENQQQVVDFKDGACAVYAVPGAGKTTTLVYRLKKLLDEGIDPKQILFVTFTNKACEEIKSRIQSLLQTQFEEELPDVFTYNGLGWQILRDNREIVGDLKLLTAMDEKRLLMECIESLTETLAGFNLYKIEGKYGLLATVLRSIKNLDDKDKCEQEIDKLQHDGKDVRQINILKEKLKQRISEENYITFDDQILLAKKLLQEHPDILSHYGNRWKYIMADEFQDSSQDNVDLLYSIADAGSRNIVVVGDVDQSIYGWRNGSPEYLLHFNDEYPECKKILMKDNFRSAAQILDASNHLISKNVSRIEMFMVAHKKSNALPYRLRDCGVSKVTEVLELLRKNRYEYGDIAILSRNNAPLIKAKAFLDNHGISSIGPVEYLIKDNIFVLIKDILDLYYLGFTDVTDISFLRYLLASKVNIPIKTDLKESFYRNCVQYHDMVPIEPNNMDSMMAYDVEDAEMQKNELYLAFRNLYHLFTGFYDFRDAAAALKSIIVAFNVEPDTPVILELERIIDYQDFHNLEDFWNYLCLMVDLQDERQIEHKEVPDKVNLMTTHGSKGKEFPAVILLQAEDFGITEEERRLLYVGMTRAKKVLFTLESCGKECDLLNEIKDFMQIQFLQ